MDKRQNLELIADISNANGAPGFEDDVVAQIRRHAEGPVSYTHLLRRDP